MNLIDKHTKNGKFRLMNFVEELAGIPCRDQLRTAREITERPIDYAEPVSMEQQIINNADRIEAIFLTYVKKAEHTPAPCLDVLRADVGEKLIELIGE